VGTASLLTGWWFVRNIVLYGDLTGQSAVALTGAEFESIPAGPLGLAQRALTYLTLPTEYLRNLIEAPTWVDVAAVVVGLVLLTGLVLLAARDWRRYARWPVIVVGLVAAASVAAWLVQSTFGWPVAFRTAYGALPLFALAAGTATRIVRRRRVAIAVLAITSAAQLATTGWVLLSLAALDSSPML
jgi:D-alanyl-D-alanine carboxypeptidase (penicillin-binding protein 5/6)